MRVLGARGALIIGMAEHRKQLQGATQRAENRRQFRLIEAKLERQLVSNARLIFEPRFSDKVPSAVAFDNHVNPEVRGREDCLALEISIEYRELLSEPGEFVRPQFGLEGAAERTRSYLGLTREPVPVPVVGTLWIETPESAQS